MTVQSSGDFVSEIEHLKECLQATTQKIAEQKKYQGFVSNIERIRAIRLVKRVEQLMSDTNAKEPVKRSEKVIEGRKESPGSSRSRSIDAALAHVQSWSQKNESSSWCLNDRLAPKLMNLRTYSNLY